MLFQMPLNDETLRNISLGLYISMTIIYGIFAIIFAQRYIVSKKQNIKNPVYITGIFLFVFFMIGRILFIRFDFLLGALETGQFDENLWDWKIAIFFQLAGFGVVFYTIEHQLFRGKDKGLLFIGYLISLILVLLAPDVDLAQTITLILLIFASFIPFGYLYLAMKSTGILRRNATLIFSGFIVFMIFTMVASEIAMDIFTPMGISPYLLHSIAVVGRILGATLIAIGYALPSK